jgi:hypothetical protein
MSSTVSSRGTGSSSGVGSEAQIDVGVSSFEVKVTSLISLSLSNMSLRSSTMSKELLDSICGVRGGEVDVLRGDGWQCQ